MEVSDESVIPVRRILCPYEPSVWRVKTSFVGTTFEGKKDVYLGTFSAALSQHTVAGIVYIWLGVNLSVNCERAKHARHHDRWLAAYLPVV